MIKNTYTMIGLSLALAPLSFAQEAPAVTTVPTVAQPTPEEVRQGFSYLIGQQLGSSLATDLSELQISDIDAVMLMKGIEDGMANRVDPEMAQKDVRVIMEAFVSEMERRVLAKAEANAAAGKAFLEENAKKEGVVVLPSGLQYKVLSAGTGRKYDAATDGAGAIAMVTYEGRKTDGSVFDASETPIQFPIDGVIPGFSEALKLMPIGSEWEIYIPAELAYGLNGPGVIGPNATLIFKLKLVDFMPPRGSQSNPIMLTPEQVEQIMQQQR
ncbi:MAG: FKBP-type peptidyl-prolyl cis-trans isomerase [Akkermansiaceae bacterium]|nr:FKBP-type peptidyl-prolyl cis-trans isomerase [Akkermansiaceae bacterium]